MGQNVLLAAKCGPAHSMMWLGCIATGKLAAVEIKTYLSKGSGIYNNGDYPLSFTRLHPGSPRRVCSQVLRSARVASGSRLIELPENFRSDRRKHQGAPPVKDHKNGSICELATTRHAKC